MIYQTIELFHQEIENAEYSEMTEFERDFLCGMLKKKKPEKLLEVGVSAGGTTMVILECLKRLGLKSKMYSVDVSKFWYRSDKRETGFAAKKYIEQQCGDIQHEFILGQSIPYVIEKIGAGIDFLILDTTHCMPGEFLDFLICLPYLQEGCIVILHDVIENHITCRNHEIATKLLFDFVHGNKWYMGNHENEIGEREFPNIAGFEVDGQTRKNIFGIFSGLTISWEYMPPDEELNRYLEVIEKHYPREYYEWSESVVSLQKYTHIRKEINWHYGLDHEWLKMKWKQQKNIFLYGGGYWARTYSEYARINQLPLNGWIISDEQDMVDTGQYSLPVFYLGDLPYQPDECAIILALDRQHFGMVRKNLVKKGYYMVL